MTNKPENPPAFPSANDVRFGEYTTEGHAGLTMRDYFAAKAMHALMIAPEKHTVVNADQCARVAYLTADAMLAERAKHD